MAKIPSRPFRLGGGEVEHAFGEQSRTDARRRFLNAIRDLKPQVLEGLAGQPLAAYQSAVASLGHQAMPPTWDTLVVYADDEDWGETFVPLRDALDHWAHRWNLCQCGPWCLAITLQTLGIWTRFPSALERRDWEMAYGGVLATRREERLFRFEHEGWEPTSDTRREFKDAILRAAEREVDAYCDHVEALSRERGFVPTPTKRKDTDFAWLARVIVDERSCGEIARDVGKSRRRVEMAVDEAAQLVGVHVKHPPN
jgi:hypothetical protein